MKLRTLAYIAIATVGVGGSVMLYAVLGHVSPTSNESCRLLTCHGLNIKCGISEPLICTMEYQLGDKCLQHAQCGIINGACSEIKNSAFETCKSCMQNCMSKSSADVQQQFACEQTCL